MPLVVDLLTVDGVLGLALFEELLVLGDQLLGVLGVAVGGPGADAVAVLAVGVGVLMQLLDVRLLQREVLLGIDALFERALLLGLLLFSAVER